MLPRDGPVPAAGSEPVFDGESCPVVGFGVPPALRLVSIERRGDPGELPEPVCPIRPPCRKCETFPKRSASAPASRSIDRLGVVLPAAILDARPAPLGLAEMDARGLARDAVVVEAKPTARSVRRCVLRRGDEALETELSGTWPWSGISADP